MPLLSASFALLAAGCGGGSSDGGGANSTTVPLAPVLTYTNPTDSVQTLTGTINDQAFKVSFTYKAPIESTDIFEGVQTKFVQQDAIFSQTAPSVSSKDQLGAKKFFNSDNIPLGWVESDGEYTVQSGITALPSTGTVGDSWAASEITYKDSTKATTVSKGKLTLSLEADTASTATAVIKNVTTCTDSGYVLTGIQKFKVSTSGVAQFVSATFTGTNCNGDKRNATLVPK